MVSGDYAAASGRLKLKGVKDSRIDKKKKKKKKEKEKSVDPEAGSSEQKQNKLGDEKTEVENERGEREGTEGRERDRWTGKTEAERRFEERKRRRLDERLLKEGVKSHKERVEEFNKYLANLSEHHDMPRIGPG
ncbi:hypothetical protein BDZ91DRAFT_769852 [Kalaharituber pfeilii]|nr:hypothetical protein BDZ91DRAFT_769852 [Kalaharituber pfeilii]